MMELVTVTCDRDKEIFLLQAQSIDMYIEEPCIHWVIIESSKYSMEHWNEILAPFYTRHTLKLITMNVDKTVDYRPSGRWRQQIFKFKIATEIQSEFYLILDSKNFFIRPTDLSKWPIDEGNGCLTDEHHQNDLWLPWINDIKKVTGFAGPDNYWITQTPFVCRTSTVRRILNTIDYEGMFLDRKTNENPSPSSPSEFLLYGFFAENEPRHYHPKKRPHQTFWKHDGIPSDDTIQEHYNNPHVLVLGFHRNMLDKFDPKLYEVAKFLESKGFDYKIAENALLSFCTVDNK